MQLHLNRLCNMNVSNEIEEKMEINSFVLKVNHSLKTVSYVSFKNKPIDVHVFTGFEGGDMYNSYHKYCTYATTLLPKRLNRYKPVKVMTFDDNKMMEITEMSADNKMYFVHNHYYNNYTYALTPGLKIHRNNIRKMYTGAPVFDENGRWVSCISEVYIEDNSEFCIFPLENDSTSSLRGLFQFNGYVYFTHNEDKINFDKIVPQNQIDVYVNSYKSNTYINLTFNGKIVNSLHVKAPFAGNVLII
ncbi:P26B [Urbanus proteus nucleopolyhedrovirus]|uniref:P26B n=1 Tax=Urbanus proteus nucleopolyhedrovirus TaxID=1675866 RepID=A0A161C6Y1_9ABAC|nr:P26B [Urbanus proteus nucleopolyhedrovirus]AKR17355.1 P26B [Urbanus proteus nucleopolyhedrovirus]